MAQANTGGGVEEPDPMVLKMMILTVAKFRGAFCVRASMHQSCVPRSRRWFIKFSCFLVFCVRYYLVPLQCSSGVNNNVLVLSGSNL